MLFERIDWDDANLYHATRHGVTAEEIEQAIANATTVRRNRRNRSGNVRIDAETDAGRKVVVIAAHGPWRRSLRPITAWEA